MRRKRNRKQSAPHPTAPPFRTAGIALPNHLTADEMQHILAKAIIEAEDIRKQREQTQKERERQEWLALLGYKDYSKESHTLKRGIKCFGNRIQMGLRILRLSKRKIKGDRATVSLLKTLLSGFFTAIRWALIGVSLICFAYVPLQYVAAESSPQPWYINVFLLVIAVVSWMIARILKIAAAEMDRLEDRNYLLGIFASVTSVISIVLAIIAVVKG